MIRMIPVALCVGLLSLSGCAKKAIVRFTQKPAELHSSDALTQLMLVNKSPKIVLRVPRPQDDLRYNGVTSKPTEPIKTGRQVVVKERRGKAATKYTEIQQQYDETALYNAIEKQLFKEGFSVRDRALFNQVLPGESYKKIGNQTDTDLILELISIERPVGYNTNVCYVQDGDSERSVKMRQDYRTLGGASVEFKLIQVKTNQVVGNYKIHYTPCTDDACRGYYKKNTGFRAFQWVRPGETKAKITAYEAIDQNDLESFMADATHQLVQTMR
ncbi:hypothetical protein F5984_18640 [Rudanella paleaurantiibacter]|uniref:Lipoprotein n=1 Tax=Rudanella paleaurantiibacter TaxID=2614655 RepID=A0A7J5TXU3_9BACT|nr:hypothetical protein [Rudanella paleaurantiibacter]KAB7728391.1 hypothetical protein F5984_18640 [Rudanella paleaurantiibacter]